MKVRLSYSREGATLFADLQLIDQSPFFSSHNVQIVLASGVLE